MISADELNYDLKKWLCDLAEARSDLIDLTKSNPNGFINDIGVLLKCSIRLKNRIINQEKRILTDFNSSIGFTRKNFCKDHRRIRLEVEALRFKIFNLRALMNKLHEPSISSKSL